MFKRIQKFFDLTSENQAKRVVYDVIMYTCIIYAYTILRVSKDAVSVSVGKGSAILSFLKTYVTLPASLIAWYLFGILNNNFKRTPVFRIVILSFVTFFTLYAYVLGPNRAALSISPEKAKDVVLFLTQLDIGFFKIGSLFASIYKNVICNWTVSLFYAVCELWGTLCISQLFWGFVVSTTDRVNSAKTFAIYQVVSSIGSILTAFMSTLIVQRVPEPFQTEISLWDKNLQNITISLLISSLIALYFQNLSNANAEQDSTILREAAPLKKKMSIGDSIKIVTKSPTLTYLTIIVGCYGASAALIENVVKNLIGKLSAFNPTSNFALSVGNIGIQGIVQIVVGILVYKWMATAKWKDIAIIAPITFAVTGMIFFGSYFLPFIPAFLAKNINMLKFNLNMGAAITAAQTVAYIGQTQAIASKTVKYSFLDVARERSYLPLNAQEKSQGKASVDVLGSRIGKAGGGFLISTFLIPVFANVNLLSWQQVDSIVPQIAVLYAFFVGLMLFATWRLIPIYDAKDKEQAAIDKEKFETDLASHKTEEHNL
jgi:AAA family ATP:ADP antiporter